VIALIIETMNKMNIWLWWALGIFGLGLLISLSAMASLKIATTHWIMLPPEIWWGVMVGLTCSVLCTVAGIILAVRGLMIKARE
jgi:hypothetical protein